MGPTPAPRPRRAQRWLHHAELGGGLRQSPNDPIARRCRRRRARPGHQRVRRLRSRRIGGVRRPSPRRRLPCRVTPLHYAASNGHSASIAELLLRGADGAVQDNNRYRRAAPHSRNRKPQQPRARRRTPKQWAEDWGKLAEYEAGESQVHSARRLTAPSRNAAGADGYAFSVRRRHSPIQRAGRRRSTRTVTDALAACLAVHYCTGGSNCRARRARAAALIGST